MNNLNTKIKELSTSYKTPYSFLCKVANVLQEFNLTTPQFELYLYELQGVGNIPITQNDEHVGYVYYKYYRSGSFTWNFECCIK